MNANPDGRDRWGLLMALIDEFRENEPLPLQGAAQGQFDLKALLVNLFRESWMRRTAEAVDYFISR